MRNFFVASIIAVMLGLVFISCETTKGTSQNPSDPSLKGWEPSWKRPGLNLRSVETDVRRSLKGPQDTPLGDWTVVGRTVTVDADGSILFPSNFFSANSELMTNAVSVIIPQNFTMISATQMFVGLGTISNLVLDSGVATNLIVSNLTINAGSVSVSPTGGQQLANFNFVTQYVASAIISSDVTNNHIILGNNLMMESGEAVFDEITVRGGDIFFRSTEAKPNGAGWYTVGSTTIQGVSFFEQANGAYFLYRHVSLPNFYYISSNKGAPLGPYWASVIGSGGFEGEVFSANGGASGTLTAEFPELPASDQVMTAYRIEHFASPTGDIRRMTFQSGATSIVDQSSALLTSTWDFNATRRWVLQSFVSRTNGFLLSIDAAFSEGLSGFSPHTVSLEIYNGSGTNLTPISSTPAIPNVMMPGGGLFSFKLDTPLAITNGNLYTWQLRYISGGDKLGFWFGIGDPYPGGYGQADGGFGGPASLQDIYFQTVVDSTKEVEVYADNNQRLIFSPGTDLGGPGQPLGSVYLETGTVYLGTNVLSIDTNNGSLSFNGNPVSVAGDTNYNPSLTNNFGTLRAEKLVLHGSPDTALSEVLTPSGPGIGTPVFQAPEIFVPDEGAGNSGSITDDGFTFGSPGKETTFDEGDFRTEGDAETTGDLTVGGDTSMSGELNVGGGKMIVKAFLPQVLFGPLISFDTILGELALGSVTVTETFKVNAGAGSDVNLMDMVKLNFTTGKVFTLTEAEYQELVVYKNNLIQEGALNGISIEGFFVAEGPVGSLTENSAPLGDYDLLEIASMLNPDGDAISMGGEELTNILTPPSPAGTSAASAQYVTDQGDLITLQQVTDNSGTDPAVTTGGISAGTGIRQVIVGGGIGAALAIETFDTVFGLSGISTTYGLFSEIKGQNRQAWLALNNQAAQFEGEPGFRVTLIPSDDNTAAIFNGNNDGLQVDIISGLAGSTFGVNVTADSNRRVRLFDFSDTALFSGEATDETISVVVGDWGNKVGATFSSLSYNANLSKESEAAGSFEDTVDLITAKLCTSANEAGHFKGINGNITIIANDTHGIYSQNNAGLYRLELASANQAGRFYDNGGTKEVNLINPNEVLRVTDGTIMTRFSDGDYSINANTKAKINGTLDLTDSKLLRLADGTDTTDGINLQQLDKRIPSGSAEGIIATWNLLADGWTADDELVASVGLLILDKTLDMENHVIFDMAPGVSGNDAVNVDQLNAVSSTSASIAGGGGNFWAGKWFWKEDPIGTVTLHPEYVLDANISPLSLHFGGNDFGWNSAPGSSNVTMQLINGDFTFVDGGANGGDVISEKPILAQNGLTVSGGDLESTLQLTVGSETMSDTDFTSFKVTRDAINSGNFVLATNTQAVISNDVGVAFAVFDLAANQILAIDEGYENISLGLNAIASGSSFAAGLDSSAVGNSIAIGRQSGAGGPFGVAIGPYALSIASQSIQIGAGTNNFPKTVQLYETLVFSNGSLVLSGDVHVLGSNVVNIGTYETPINTIHARVFNGVGSAFQLNGVPFATSTNGAIVISNVILSNTVIITEGPGTNSTDAVSYGFMTNYIAGLSHVILTNATDFPIRPQVNGTNVVLEGELGGGNVFSTLNNFYDAGTTQFMDNADALILTMGGNLVLTNYAETDPLYIASAAATIMGADIVNWNTSFGWGNHGIAGYLLTEVDPLLTGWLTTNTYVKTETDSIFLAWVGTNGYIKTEADPLFVVSVAAGIVAQDVVDWGTAFTWGDHSTNGYLSAFSELDPTYTTSVAFSVSALLTNEWTIAFNRGDHSTNGYLSTFVEVDPIFTSSVAFNLTDSLTNWWTTAFTWGDHALLGYITNFTELDPLYSSSVAFSITSGMTNNWTTTFTWGNHANEGYARLTNAFNGVGSTGLVTSSSADTNNFLRGDGSWVSAGAAVTLQLSWKYSSSVIDNDPGSGKFRINDAVHTNATFIFINDKNDEGFDLSEIVDRLDTNDLLYIQDKADASSSIMYDITGPATDAGTYFKIPVAVITNGSGSQFSNNKVCGFLFHLSGNDTFVESDPFLAASPTNDWNTAFSFGDHATKGYLTVNDSVAMLSSQNVFTANQEIYKNNFLRVNEIRNSLEASSSVIVSNHTLSAVGGSDWKVVGGGLQVEDPILPNHAVSLGYVTNNLIDGARLFITWSGPSGSRTSTLSIVSYDLADTNVVGTFYTE